MIMYLTTTLTALAATPPPSSPADASTVEGISATASDIVLGQVISRRFEQEIMMTTYTTVRITRSIKGDAANEEVVLKTPGGQTPSGKWAVVPGASFSAPLPEQRVILSGTVENDGLFTPLQSGFSVIRESPEGLRGSRGALIVLTDDGQFLNLKSTLPPPDQNVGWVHVAENGDVIPDEVIQMDSSPRAEATPQPVATVEMSFDEVAALLEAAQ